MDLDLKEIFTDPQDGYYPHKFWITDPDPDLFFKDEKFKKTFQYFIIFNDKLPVPFSRHILFHWVMKCSDRIRIRPILG